MQWSLRTLLMATAASAGIVKLVPTYGISVTLVSPAILLVAWIIYCRLPANRRGPCTRATFVCGTLVVLYVGTFATFRAVRTLPFIKSTIVVFSLNPAAQQFALAAYWPLIQLFPGDSLYPTGDQIYVLNRHSPGYFLWR